MCVRACVCVRGSLLVLLFICECCFVVFVFNEEISTKIQHFFASSSRAKQTNSKYNPNNITTITFSHSQKETDRQTHRDREKHRERL